MCQEKKSYVVLRNKCSAFDCGLPLEIYVCVCFGHKQIYELVQARAQRRVSMGMCESAVCSVCCDAVVTQYQLFMQPMITKLVIVVIRRNL